MEESCLFIDSRTSIPIAKWFIKFKRSGKYTVRECIVFEQIVEILHTGNIPVGNLNCKKDFRYSSNVLAKCILGFDKIPTRLTSPYFVMAKQEP